jgi:mRNA-degrading endonuclease toxin of MazEF toxin-antitoxin module
MNAWEIRNYAFAGAGEHPAVIVSHPLRAQRKETVEVLLCTTFRPGQALAPHEVVLNGADGLDWSTVCRCDLIYSVAKKDLAVVRGVVSPPRRRDIIRKIIASHGWV